MRRESCWDEEGRFEPVTAEPSRGTDGRDAARACDLPHVSGQASASVVRLDFVDDERVEYLAAAGEVNVVTIARSGSTYTVTDSAPLTAGSGCTQVSAGEATCPATGVRRVTARAGDLNDRITR